jgi:hypothetical protein
MFVLYYLWNINMMKFYDILTGFTSLECLINV